MGIYKKHVMPYLSAFILGPIFMIVEVVGEVLMPKLMSMIINEGIQAVQETVMWSQREF